MVKPSSIWPVWVQSGKDRDGSQRHRRHFQGQNQQRKNRLSISAKEQGHQEKISRLGEDSDSK